MRATREKVAATRNQVSRRAVSAIGESLREHRKRLKLTQAGLAERADTTQRVVSNVEGGGGTLATTIKLADAMGFRLDARSLPQAANIGGRLALLRKRAKLGRRALAKLAAISLPAVEQLESGYGVHLATLEAVATALGVQLVLIKKGERLRFFEAAGTSSSYHGWTTPDWIMKTLHSVFGTFDLDPCAQNSNGRGSTVMARKYYTPEDGDISLQIQWKGVVFVNPPFGRSICKWVEKCRTSSEHGTTVVALLPARVETGWWFSHIVEGSAHVFQLRGRLKYGDGEGTAPFGSAIVIWSPSADQIAAMRRAIPNARYIPPLIDNR